MFGSSSSLVAAVFSATSFTGAVLANPRAAAPRPATTFAECQEKTLNPLQGCPEGTVYVSANDTRADFTTIQDAIISVGNDTEPHYILVGAGIYKERRDLSMTLPLCPTGYFADSKPQSSTSPAPDPYISWASPASPPSTRHTPGMWATTRLPRMTSRSGSTRQTRPVACTVTMPTRAS